MKGLPIAAIIFFMVTLVPSNALPAPLADADQSSLNTIAIIKQGKLTPFDGFLLSPDVYARLSIDKEFMKKELELDKQTSLALQKNDFQLKLDVTTFKLESTEREMDERLKIKDGRILDLEKKIIMLEEDSRPSTWDDVKPWVFFAAGAAAVILGAWAISMVPTE